MRSVGSLILFLILSLVNLRCSVNEVYVSPYPVVNIVSPTARTQILDTTTIVIEASDDKGVVRVELYIDGKIPPGGTMLYVPYQYAWNTSSLPDTSVHQLYAKAYDTDSNSTVSPTVTVTIYKFQPTNLTAQLVGDTLVVLSWKDNCSKETGYEVVERGSDSLYTLVASLPPNTITVNLPGVYLTQQSYTYMVRAVIDTLKSAYSNAQTVTPLVTAPADLTASMVADTLIALNWTIRLHSIAQYIQVEESTDNGPFAVIDTLPAAIDSLAFRGSYKLGSSYQFRVMGFTSHGNKSSYSNTSTAQVVFPAPTALKGIPLGPTSIQLQWTDNSSFEKQFSIERKTATTNFAEIGRVGANVTTYTDNALDTSSTYTYRVRALTDLNASAYTQSLTFSYQLYFFEEESIEASGQAISGIVFVANSNTLITNGTGNTAALWDATTGTQTGSMTGSPAPITSLAINAQGTVLVTGSDDGSVLAWDVPSRSITRTITAFSSRITSVALSPDAQFISCACATEPFLKIWRIADGSLVWSDSAHTETINATIYSPDGTAVLSASDDHSIKEWNAATGSLLRTLFKETDYFRSLAVSGPKDMLVGGSVSQLNPLNGWQLSTGTALGGFIQNGASVGTSGFAVAFSAGGDSLVCGYGDTYVRVWGGNGWNLLAELSGHNSEVHAVQFNGSGNLIASGSNDGILKIWRLKKSWR